eukprot:UN02162
MLCCGMYGYKIDTWSLGCIAAELYTRMPIFRGRNYVEQIQLYLTWVGTSNDLTWITNRGAKNWIASMTAKPALDTARLLPNSTGSVRDFISGILVLNPHKRPDITSVLKHEWLKEFFFEEDYRQCPEFSMLFEEDKAIKHIFGVRHRIYTELHNFRK